MDKRQAYPDLRQWGRLKWIVLCSLIAVHLNHPEPTMLLQQIHDPYLSQYAYLIGCPESGEALIIDAQRDVDRYLDLAAAEDLKITAAAETHIHADFLGGVRQLVEGTGGVAGYLSKMGGEDWQYAWAQDHKQVHLLGDGDSFTLGNIEITEIDAKTGTVLDVRSNDEYAEGHVPGAVNLPHTRLVADAEQLPGKDEPLTVHCGSGARASLASAALARMGHKVIFADGKFADWKQQKQK